MKRLEAERMVVKANKPIFFLELGAVAKVEYVRCLL